MKRPRSAPADRENRDDMHAVSRRRFIETAVVGSLAVSAPVLAETPPAEQPSKLEELLERYGSELGAVRRVERG